MPDTDQPHCPLCNASDTRLIHDQPDARYFPRRIHKCGACGFAFVYPLPDQATLGKVYNEANYFHDPDQQFNPLDPRPGTVNRARSRLAWLLSKGVKGRVLDVGCAEGVFVEQAITAGLDGCGVELSEYAADIARQRTGADIYTDELSQLIKQDRQFDALTLWDVLEHVTDPVAFLTECKALIRPGGWIALSTPNQKSYNGVLKGDQWKGYRDGPEHLYFYNANTLSQMLAKAGFTTLATRTQKIAPVLMRWAIVLGWGGDLEIIGQKPHG